MPGLGQGHNQKKDTHTLDFGYPVLRAQTVDIAYFPLRQGFFGKKRFNDR
jgi:hypothetical protein